ncbi:MAG: AmmeMemoRadiSam system protein B [Candidatus Sumerlaeota bacterium]|nr:AmmeMemoRadiSam system protein B [Candidatus Sumerlaeota bacterium]
MTEKPCREPVQAGRFYPADSLELREMAEGFMRAARLEAMERPAMGLVSPHAGYVFSGSTAGWSYRQIQGRPYRRVVVVAPSHYAIVNGASIFSGNAYRTPLGRIPMDEAVVGALRKRTDVFQCVPEAHRQEHSLEVQLPFLQTALGEWALVPIIVSGSTDDDWRKVADAISEALAKAGARLGEDTLIVASSDLYHGPSAQACERSDTVIAAELEQFDPERLARRARDREIQACGAGPIAIMMKVVRSAGAQQVRVLHRTNSAKERGGEADYVVGYLSAAAF